MATATPPTPRSSVALPDSVSVGASRSCWLGAGVVTVPSGGVVSGGRALICTNGRVASSLPAKSQPCTVTPYAPAAGGVKAAENVTDGLPPGAGGVSIQLKAPQLPSGWSHWLVAPLCTA